jgi:hypothetical protein
MFRRLPIMPLVFAVTLGLFGLTSVLVAQQPAKPTPTDTKTPKDIKRSQEENAKLFKRFSDEMLHLALKWEKSENPDDRERAKTLRAALKIATEKGVENLFKDLEKGLGTADKDFNNLMGKDKKLIAALAEIMEILSTEDEQARLAREIKELKELIAKIEAIKKEQENVRARTDNNRSDKDNLAKDQKDLTGKTKDVANSFPGDKKNQNGNANAGDGKDDKSEHKPESKPGEASPENKPDTKDPKSDNKNGDGAGMPMGGMGDPKNSGDQKPSPMGGMQPGDSKDSPMGGMGAGEPKPGEQKPMGGNPMDPKNPMGGDQKPMSGDSKAQGEGKGDQKPSAGQQGGDGKPMSSQGMPMAGGGQPSQSKPSGGQPSSGGGQPSPGGPQKPKDPAQENVEQAIPQQQGAEQDIRKGDNGEAGKKQDEAIKKLEEAIRELEKRLKQLREKELEKLLANLEERVGRMLRLQIEVKLATELIDVGVLKNKNQKTSADIQKSQAEADKELTIISEADKALKLMEGEGTAVVFAGLLSEVKNDMIAVQKRLNEGRVEKQTQDIEQDIIDQLTMMKEALKKAKQDLQNQQNKPSDSNSNGKPNNKLLDLINELKLIKSLQEQVNKRTIGYSKQDPGEQAKDPLIQGELKQLSERQRLLEGMLHKIATEANQ